MKTLSFTDRILITGAIGFSLVVTGLTAVSVCDLGQTLWNWREEIHLGGVTFWLQLPFKLLFIFLPVALVVAVWRRIVSRCRSLSTPSLPGYPSLAPRSKYAVWKPARPANGRNAAFGMLKPRKKIGR